MPSPSPSTATAAAAGAPLRRCPCAPRRLTPASCSLPSRALVKFAPAPMLAHTHRPRPCLAVARAASADAATGAKSPVSGGQMLVFVPPHPLIKHWVSVLRNEQTPCAVFRSAMAELSRLLVYEASRDWLPTITGEIQTPVAVSSVEFIDPREHVMVVPILRAGLALAENVSSVLPATKTYHLGHVGTKKHFNLQYISTRKKSRVEARGIRGGSDKACIYAPPFIGYPIVCVFLGKAYKEFMPHDEYCLLLCGSKMILKDRTVYHLLHFGWQFTMPLVQQRRPA